MSLMFVDVCIVWLLLHTLSKNYCDGSVIHMFWVQDSATLENQRRLRNLLKKANINRPTREIAERERPITNQDEQNLD